uniref:Uncharacterized protein n=1 Tax=Arundo donax TaxID=35708 RepID=A0A0A8Y7T3_ARUDO
MLQVIGSLTFFHLSCLLLSIRFDVISGLNRCSGCCGHDCICRMLF